MADSLYPIPRELRQTGILVGDGVNSTYGPFSFKIFDTLDVTVYTLTPPAAQFVVATATVTKVANLQQDFFTVTFPSILPASTLYVVSGERLAERKSAITSGNQLSPPALEKEISKVVVTLQELRRDLKRTVKVEFGQAGQVLPKPEEGKLLGWAGDRLLNITVPRFADALALAQAVDEIRVIADEVAAVAMTTSPVVDYPPVEVVSGQSSVTIAGGYQPGKVAYVYLDGNRLTEWSATDGITVTFPAITDYDLGDQPSATMVIGIGNPSVGTAALDGRYLLLKTGDELKGIPLERFGPGWRNNNTDHTALFHAAAASGENIFIPPVDAQGGEKWNVEDPIEWLSDVSVRGNGDNSKTKLMRSTGDRACPVFIAKEEGGNLSFQDLHIDGNGFDLINPSDADQFQVVYGSAFLICAQETLLRNVTVRNGWDNGIVLVPQRDGHGAAGYPNDCRIYFCKTFNNGCGFHELGGPGYIGSGLNNATGARCHVIGHFDRGSRGAVTVDDGGGANGFALGCTSMLNAGDDNVGNAPTPGGQGSGTAFYSGNPDWSFNECKAYFPHKHGFWLAHPGGMQIRGCEVIGAQEHGYYLTGGGHIIDSCRAKNVGQKADNVYSGFFVDTPFGNSQNNMISNCEVVWDVGTANQPRFGYSEGSYGGFIPGSMIKGGRMNGKTAGIAPLYGKTSYDMVEINGFVSLYVPVTGPGSLPGSAIYRDANGFLKTK